MNRYTTAFLEALSLMRVAVVVLVVAVVVGKLILGWLGISWP